MTPLPKTAPDILLRLGFLSALNVVLYWLPVFYWTTYRSHADDLSRMLLIFALVICPLSWILGFVCYVQFWRIYRTASTRSRLAYCWAASLLFVVILSTVIPIVYGR